MTLQILNLEDGEYIIINGEKILTPIISSGELKELKGFLSLFDHLVLT